METKAIEKSRWNNSLSKSIAIHVFLLLIAWLLKLPLDPDKTIDTQYAVTVNFQAVEFNNSTSSNSTKSRSTEGAQRAKSEAPRKLETAKTKPVEVPVKAPPKPTPTPPAPDAQPTDPVFSETTTEESDIQAIEEPIEVDDPEPEFIPEDIPLPEPTAEPVVLNPELPSIEDIIGDIDDEPIDIAEETDIFSDEEGDDRAEQSSKGGSGDGDPSLKDGDSSGTGKGDRGTGKGNDDSGNDNDSGIGTGDHGEGEFDASGDGIFGRKVIYQDPSMAAVYAKSGKIVFKVCISRQGSVSFIEIDEFKTTQKDVSILRAALNALQKYKYEPDFTAPKEQCGTYTVNVDNYNGIRG